MRIETIRAVPSQIGRLISGETAADARRRAVISANAMLIPFAVGWWGYLTKNMALLGFGYGGLLLCLEETIRHSINFQRRTTIETVQQER